MEAEAKHDFDPQDPGAQELAFKRGDKLLLLNYGDPVQWYNATKNGEVGIVPENYIHIDAPTWYMGRISRALAEQMLIGNKNDGAFLVRLSESSPADFSLSVKCGPAVQHFRILKTNDNEIKYFLWSTRFNSINELVEHYRKTPVRRNSDITLRDMDEDDQFIVEALFEFNPEDEQDQELGFQKGELITVFDKSDDNWWGGSNGIRQGFFPRTYVQPFKPLRVQ